MNNATRMALVFAFALLLIVIGYNLVNHDPSVGAIKPDVPLAAELRQAEVEQGAADVDDGGGDAASPRGDDGRAPTPPSNATVARNDAAVPVAPTPVESADVTGDDAVTQPDEGLAFIDALPDDTVNAGEADTSAHGPPPTLTLGRRPPLLQRTTGENAASGSKSGADVAGERASTDAAPVGSSGGAEANKSSELSTSKSTSASDGSLPSTGANTGTGQVEPKSSDTKRDDAKPGDNRGNSGRPAAPPVYAIAAGDSFSTIAEKFYGDERKWILIEEANPNVDPRRLKLGQVIKLPPPEAPQAPAAKTAAANAPASKADAARADAASPPREPVAPPGGKLHEVKPGQTLSSIAREHYGDPNTWRTIFDANRDLLRNNPNVLPAGAKLVIPAKQK
jgi:nucleoid-associated protein YgaU